MHDLGQYLHHESALHRSDPRVKLIAVLALSPVILHIEVPGLIMVGALILGAALMGKIGPFELFRTTRPVWPFFMMLFLVYILFTPGTPLAPLASYSIKISYEGLHLGASQLFRFVLLILAASLLTMTTSLTEITMGLEHLLRPLRIVRISSHNIALMVSMALRFIPLLQHELQQIQTASAARGADFRCGSPLDKIRLTVYLATPLTLNIIRRSDELAEAMEARGYRPGPRTYLCELAFSRSDYYALGFIAVIIMFLWYLG
ncbi:MAG TPA: energy-coupling factor transporter transmembrane protein EcfT [Syntrophomonas sp.]|jgi:biotin transport system permease protein/energy-coupling factor transport system permease protein|nr:energy-coupling factor transporter transmembrane protein EcfT [Syntrophomonas sp.]